MGEACGKWSCALRPALPDLRPGSGDRPSTQTLRSPICLHLGAGHCRALKGLRYLLVGAYCHPRLEAQGDREIPEEEDVGIEAEIDPFEADEIGIEYPEEESGGGR